MKIKEEEIRPEKIFDEYLRLAKLDTEIYFNNIEREDINCPACKKEGEDWTLKHGFNYQICNQCQTIYVSPRPKPEAFNEYYKDSPSTKYWATTFYKLTESARREKLWKPKAKLVSDRLSKYEADDKFKYIIDIGGGYGVFDEELIKISKVEPIIIEPSIHLAEICRKKGLTVIEKFMENISPNELPFGRKCFVSFELFEHLYDPEKFLKVVYNTMNEGDIFIFTTLSGMGIDIQLLKGNSKSVSPPHHLNFFNPKSVAFLLDSLGFIIHEAITPGKLDIDILKKNTNYLKDKYWNNLFEYLTENELDEFQNFISQSGLSSHMMITCTK